MQPTAVPAYSLICAQFLIEMRVFDLIGPGGPWPTRQGYSTDVTDYNVPIIALGPSSGLVGHAEIEWSKWNWKQGWVDGSKARTHRRPIVSRIKCAWSGFNSGAAQPFH